MINCDSQKILVPLQRKEQQNSDIQIPVNKPVVIMEEVDVVNNTNIPNGFVKNILPPVVRICRLYILFKQRTVVPKLDTGTLLPEWDIAG